MAINVLILGAGKGTRLHPLTDKLPKALLDIGENQTILSRLLSQLISNVPDSNVWVNVSTHPNVFLDYLSSIETGLRPKVLYEPRLLGGSNTLFEISKFNDGPTLVLHGDLVLSQLYVRQLFDALTNNPRFVILCHRRDSTQARSKIVMDDSGLVMQLMNTVSANNPSINVLVNSGIYYLPTLRGIFTRPLLSKEIAESILQDLIVDKRLYALEINHKRVSVDSFRQLNDAKDLVRTRTPDL